MGTALQALLIWLGIRPPKKDEVPDWVLVRIRQATERLRALQ